MRVYEGGTKKVTRWRERERERERKTRARWTPEQWAQYREGVRTAIEKRFLADPVKFKLREMVRAAWYRRAGDFAVRVEDVEPPTVCPYLGIPLDWNSRGKMGPNSPTLDRVCSEYGYIPGNVVVCSQAGNTLKNELDAADHARLAAIDHKTLQRLRQIYGDDPGGFIDPGRTRIQDDGQPYFRRRRQRVSATKMRAKLGNFPFALTIEDVPFVARCELSGVLLDWENGMARNGATIDKIIPAYGYVRGNVRIVARRLNTAMTNATPLQRAGFAAFIERTRAELWKRYGRRPLLPRIIGNGTGEDV